MAICIRTYGAVASCVRIHIACAFCVASGMCADRVRLERPEHLVRLGAARVSGRRFFFLMHLDLRHEEMTLRRVEDQLRPMHPRKLLVMKEVQLCIERSRGAHIIVEECHEHKVLSFSR